LAIPKVYGREAYKGCNPIGYADGISRGWGMALICNYKDKKSKILGVSVWIC
jgi:alanine racemase